MEVCTIAYMHNFEELSIINIPIRNSRGFVDDYRTVSKA